MLMKKFFLLPRTKNSFLTKERLSDYAIKRKGLWSENLYTSQYNTQMLREKHNGFQHSRIQKICHPCTHILSEENTQGSTPNLMKIQSEKKKEEANLSFLRRGKNSTIHSIKQLVLIYMMTVLLLRLKIWILIQGLKIKYIYNYI